MLQDRAKALVALVAVVLALSGCASSGKDNGVSFSAGPGGPGGSGVAMGGGMGGGMGQPPSGGNFGGGNQPGSPPNGIASSGKQGGASGAAQGAAPSAAPGGGVMTFAALAESKTSKYFSDLDASTSKINAYADYLYEKGYLAGYTDRYFPAKALTRADLASMLYAKYKWAAEGFCYGDVSDDAYYYQAVMRGKASKVLEDTKYFNPDDPVTREQAAIWMFKAESQYGMPAEMASEDLASLKDASSVSADAKKAVATMLKLGVLAVDLKGKFNPESTFTRAEIAPIVYRLSMLGGGPGGMSGPGGSSGPGAPGGGSQTVDHGTAANTVTANVSHKIYSSTDDMQNALRVGSGAKVTLTNVTLNKIAGNPGTGDSSNFYGSNAAFLAIDGAVATLDDVAVNSSTRGANGIFSYGSGTKVTVNKATIRTTKDSSGGVMVAGGGSLYLNDGDIDTLGGSSAALRSDRGGGTLVVNGGTYVAHGNGSPAIYSTATVSVTGAKLSATSSEAIVIEGKNSVTLKDCTVSGNMIRDNVENIHNVMIYQSMSGDATTGKSQFSMEGGSLASGAGDLLYVTNTSCSVRLTGVNLALSNEYLLSVVGNDARTGWGVVGKNGGQCDFTADKQILLGKIKVDSISALNLALRDGSNFTGSINADKDEGNVSLTIDSSSSWTLTGDSHLTSLTGSMDTVKTNGHHLYVAGKIVK